MTKGLGSEEGALRRTLGLTSLTFYGIGVIVGAGIYSVIGPAAAAAGDGLWVSFVVAAIAAFLTALSYAELSTLHPRAGAEYVYLAHAAPRSGWIAFLVGFVLAVASTASATGVALAFGGYLQAFLPVSPVLGAGMLLCVATGVGLVGIRESSWINVILTLVEIGGLCVIVWLGAPEVRLDRLVDVGAPSDVLGVAGLVFFVYLGFEGIANLAEEARDPGRDLPRAILLSLAVTTVLYVLVAVTALALIAPERMAASSAPMAEAVRRVSPGAARAIAVIALFSTANTTLITMIGASRKLFGMASAGELPPFLGAVLRRRGTPSWAALVVLAGAVILLPLGSVAEAASLASLTSLLAFVAVNVAVVALRVTEPERPRPFRVPGAVWGIPLPPLLGVLVNVGLILQFDLPVYGAALALLGVGLLAYRLRLRFGPRRARPV